MLKQMVPKGGEVFFSEEMTVKTRFGDYMVSADLFSAQSYNEFLGRNTFYGMTERGASIQEVLEYAKLTSQLVEGRLF